VTLREALKRAKLTYRPFAHTLRISPTSISRLVNYGEYPMRIGEDEVRRRISEVLERAGIDGADIEWPAVGIRPEYTGQRRERATGHAIQRHDGHKYISKTTEEIDLMQLDRNVLSLFALRTNPFLNDVEADEDVFRFKGYDMVETAICEAIEQRGFLALTGESGSGKTTIWDGVESEYSRRDDTVICRPLVKAKDTLTPEHLARCLIYGLLGDDVRVRANAEDRGRQLSTALRAIRSGTADRKAVLFLDDAHFCTGSVLKQLKTFFEEKIGRYRLLAIILIGLPTLKMKLSEFPEIGNRIRLVEVPPVPVKEYLEFKLRRAGSSIDKLFDPAGFEAFCDRFRAPRRPPLGRPLIINAACIRAMVMLHQNGAQPGERITRDIIDQLPGAAPARRAS
jgi:type II secretory pathway predicted ATPase ExeA